MFIRVVDGKAEKVNVREFFRDQKNISFPRKPSLQLLSEYNIFCVGESDKPEVDINTQKLIRIGFTQVEGKWFEKFAVEQLPKKTAKANVLSERDRLLSKIERLQMKVAREIRRNETPSLNIHDLDLFAKKLENIEKEEGFPYSIELEDLFEEWN